MSIDTVIGLYEGFHFEGELRALNRIAAGVTDGVIVAIGSYRGQSDCALALHAQVPVYAIDDRNGSVGDNFPFSDADRVHWMRNVLTLGLGEKIRPINLLSSKVAEVWDQPIGMLFIDGGHDYDSVITDWYNFEPWLSDGSLVAFHDNNLPGVEAAIHTVQDHGDYEIELVETADLTNVYRFHRLIGTPIKVFESLGEVVPGSTDSHSVSFSSANVDVADYVAAKVQPRHPSQRSKTPPKKGKGK